MRIALGWMVGLAVLATGMTARAQCTPRFEAARTEDITIDHDARVAYLSSMSAENAPGAIDRLDLSTGTLVAMARNGGPELLNPHGIFLLVSDVGRFLFVVHHPGLGSYDQIVRYRIEGDVLAQGTVFSTPLLGALHANDVAATSPDVFYVTDFLAGRVVRYARGVWRVVADGLGLPNGIQLLASGEVLVAAYGEAKLKRFRVGSDGMLLLAGEIALPGVPDNIELGDDGSIWVAADDGPVCAFFVSKFYRLASVTAPPTLVLATTQLTGGSVVAPYDGGVLYGSFIANHFLQCSP